MTELGRLPPTGQSSSIIQQAFGNAPPRIQFNVSVFQELIIQWMLLCNISFHQVGLL